MSADTAAPVRTPVRPAGYRVVRVGKRGRFLVHRRAGLVAAALTVVLAAVCVAYLCVGESFVAPAEAVRVVLGQPSPDELVVGTLRLPAWWSGSWWARRSGSPGH